MQHESSRVLESSRVIKRLLIPESMDSVSGFLRALQFAAVALRLRDGTWLEGPRGLGMADPLVGMAKGVGRLLVDVGQKFIRVKNSRD